MPLTAPKPDAFASTFTRAFAAAVRDAAGKDGRLSTTEAAKVRAPYGDNAQNWLEKSGQASVSVEKLVAAGYGYALANGQQAAGRDGRISLVDSAKLPHDLRADFLLARAAGAAVSAEERDAAILKAVDPDFGTNVEPSLSNEVRLESLPARVQGAMRAAVREYESEAKRVGDDTMGGNDLMTTFDGPYAVKRSAADATIVGYGLHASMADWRGGWSSATTYGFDLKGKRVLEEGSTGW